MHRESLNFDDPVCILCKHKSRREIVDLSFVLLRYLQFTTASATQVRSLEKGIINAKEGISSHTHICKDTHDMLQARFASPLNLGPCNRSRWEFLKPLEALWPLLGCSLESGDPQRISIGTLGVLLGTSWDSLDASFGDATGMQLLLARSTTNKPVLRPVDRGLSANVWDCGLKQIVS